MSYLRVLADRLEDMAYIFTNSILYSSLSRIQTAINLRKVLQFGFNVVDLQI